MINNNKRKQNMAYKQGDQAKLDFIDKTISILSNLKLSPDQIQAQVLLELAPDFEASTGHKIVFNDGDSTTYKILDLSKDYMRIRDSNEDNKVLRTRCHGVHIEIKTFKKDEFNLTNDEIAYALEELAKKVRLCSARVSNLIAPCDLGEAYFQVDVTAGSDDESHDQAELHVEQHVEQHVETAIASSEDHYFNEKVVLDEIKQDSIAYQQHTELQVSQHEQAYTELQVNQQPHIEHEQAYTELQVDQQPHIEHEQAYTELQADQQPHIEHDNFHAEQQADQQSHAEELDGQQTPWSSLPQNNKADEFFEELR